MSDFDAYFSDLDDERREAMEKLRDVIRANIPQGFAEQINYNMPGWVVPHSIYPDGYHVDAKLPLPFINIASQKSHIGLYHMGIYSNPELLEWFQENYPLHCKNKLNMGKSCIRFKNVGKIPYDLVGQLCSKMTVEQWIDIYQKQIERRNK